MGYPKASEIQDFLKDAHAIWVLNGIAKTGNLDYSLYNSISSSRTHAMDLDYVLKEEETGNKIYAESFYEQYKPMACMMKKASIDNSPESREFKETFSDMVKVRFYGYEEGRRGNINKESFDKSFVNLENKSETFDKKDKLTVLRVLYNNGFASEKRFENCARISKKIAEIEPTFENYSNAVRSEISLQSNGGEKKFNNMSSLFEKAYELGMRDMESFKDHRKDGAIKPSYKKNDMKNYEKIRKELKILAGYLPEHISHSSDVNKDNLAEIVKQIKDWNTNIDKKELVSGSVIADRLAAVKIKALAGDIADTINYSGEEDRNKASDKMKRQSSDSFIKMVESRIHNKR